MAATGPRAARASGGLGHGARSSEHLGPAAAARRRTAVRGRGMGPGVEQELGIAGRAEEG